MIARVLAVSLYGLVAIAFLSAGSSVLLLGTGLLPDAIKEVLVSIGEDNPNTLHIMQEYGCLLILVGLISLGSIRHYKSSRPFHWAMTAFWGLIAWVHWFDVRGGFHSGVGEVINTVPFILFLVIGVLRHKSEGGSPGEDR